MFCPRCQRSFPDGTTHCPDDGTVLVTDANAPTPASNPAPSTAGQFAADPVASMATAAQPGLPVAGSGSNPGPMDYTGPQPAPGTLAGPRMPTSLSAGQMVGEYQISGVLGEGGMGKVYGGIQPVIGKRVAVKVLLHEFAHNPKVLNRFVQEARAVNQVRSQYIVDIFSFHELPDGRPYFVMEYLDGPPLRDFIKARQRLDFDTSKQILSCVCKGLAAAHGAEIIHRDLKPENIIVIEEPDGSLWAKILDFGIAKLMRDPGMPDLATATGVAMGTPYYMSPEQVRGSGVDHRSDIYALGIIMFEMFTGVLPYTANSYIELVNQHLFAEPPSPADVQSDVPKGIEELILHCIRKKPEDRPQSMAEFIAALNAVDPTVTARTLVERSVPAELVVPSDTASDQGTGRRPAMTAKTAPVKKSSKGLIFLIIFVFLLLAGAGGAAYYWWVYRGGEGTGPTKAGVGDGTAPATDKAHLQINTTPSGATVSIDGKKLSVTPLVTSLAPGEHSLQVELDGYQTISRTVKLYLGQDKDVTLALVKATGQAGASSSPPDAGGAGSGPDSATGEAPGTDVTVADSGAASAPPAGKKPGKRPGTKKPGGKKPGKKPGGKKPGAGKPGQGGDPNHDPDETLNPFSR